MDDYSQSAQRCTRKRGLSRSYLTLSFATGMLADAVVAGCVERPLILEGYSAAATILRPDSF
jgi:hypothetical protein